MTYREAIEYIHSFSHPKSPKRPLSRTRELLIELGSPDKELKIIHVAGTNGKGSVAAMLESIFRAAGYRTGLFTSPYIRRFNERIRVNGVDIPDSDLAELTERLRPAFDALTDRPTEFEVVTVLGLRYFAERGCDMVILEAGMGGRDDFTNVIGAPEAAVITSIGLDHTAELGSTEAEIAENKAGIIKPGTVCVYAGVSEKAEMAVLNAASKAGAETVRAKWEDIELISSDLNGSRFNYGGLQNLFVPLAGAFQPKNAATALETVFAMKKRGWKIPGEAVRTGLAEVSWQGRLELLRREPLFLLDGAHNPPAAKACSDSLAGLREGKWIILIGMMADKDIEGVIKALAPVAESFVTVAPDYPRALGSEKLKEIISSLGLKAESAETIGNGVDRAIELAGTDGAVCALGSLYLSEDIRKHVKSLRS